MGMESQRTLRKSKKKMLNKKLKLYGWSWYVIRVYCEQHMLQISLTISTPCSMTSYTTHIWVHTMSLFLFSLFSCWLNETEWGVGVWCYHSWAPYKNEPMSSVKITHWIDIMKFCYTARHGKHVRIIHANAQRQFQYYFPGTLVNSNFHLLIMYDKGVLSAVVGLSSHVVWTLNNYYDTKILNVASWAASVMDLHPWVPVLSRPTIIPLPSFFQNSNL